MLHSAKKLTVIVKKAFIRLAVDSILYLSKTCLEYVGLKGCQFSSACIEYKDQNTTLIAGNFTKDPFNLKGFTPFSNTNDKKYLIQFKKTNVHLVSDGFQADFPKGVSVTNQFAQSCFLTFSIKFTCNESVVWQTPFDGLAGTAPNPTSIVPITEKSCHVIRDKSVYRKT
jgi:hypothetical protein